MTAEIFGNALNNVLNGVHIFIGLVPVFLIIKFGLGLIPTIVEKFFLSKVKSKFLVSIFLFTFILATLVLPGSELALKVAGFVYHDKQSTERTMQIVNFSLTGKIEENI